MGWKGLTLTESGRKALNQAQTAKKLKIRSVVVGDGNPPEDFQALEGLVHPLYEITDLGITLVDAACTVTVEIPEREESYYFREIGILVETEDGVKLYVYDNCGEDAQYITASTGKAAVKRRVRLTLTVSGVAEVTVINPAVMYITYEDFQEAVDSLKTEIVTELRTGLAGKVDTEEGKDLSSNDYTDEDKHAVEGLGGLTFGQDAEGRWGYTAPGTDEVVPFGRGGSGGSGTMIVKCGNEAIPAGSIIAGGSFNGDARIYSYLHQGAAINTTCPILYAPQEIAAGGEGTGEVQVVLEVPGSLVEGELTAYKPVYIKGTFYDEFLRPEYPMVQELSDDDYAYLLIGMAVSQTEMYLYPESTICQVIDGKFTKGGAGKNYALKRIYGLDRIDQASPSNERVGYGSISFGERCIASGYCSSALGLGAKATGRGSSARGNSAGAFGENSHAESAGQAQGDNSHAECFGVAVGDVSHAEGFCTAISDYSHADGLGTEASGLASHTHGNYTKATAWASSATGNRTVATNENSHACGHENADMVGGGSAGDTTGTAFVVGNGTSRGKSNAFTVNFDGTVSASGSISGAAAADYSEYFEWEDGNLDFEDRTGLFVTLEGDRICTAGPGDGYILGIVSGAPFVLGNGDCDTWNGMFLRDEFGRVMYERAPKIEREVVADKEGRLVELKETPVLDAEGNPLYMGTRPRINPDYNPAEPYVRRSDRPEWSPVGMLGVLAVRQDGSCKVNGYCTCGEGGVAIACGREAENAYRVIKVLSDSVAKVVFR